MLLLTPTGVQVSVSDEKGERLKREGYTVPGAATAAPGPSPTPARRTRRKTSKEQEDGASNGE